MNMDRSFCCDQIPNPLLQEKRQLKKNTTAVIANSSTRMRRTLLSGKINREQYTAAAVANRAVYAAWASQAMFHTGLVD